MNREQAETIAIRVVEWLVSDDRLFRQFSNASGVSPEEARELLSESEFLASVLDFLLFDDRRVVGFCEYASLDKEVPLSARRALPGGNVPHWT